MNIDLFLQESRAKNPILGRLLSVLLDGGQIIVGDSKTSEIFKKSKFSTWISDERAELSRFYFLDMKDLLILWDPSREQLLELASNSCCQIACLEYSGGLSHQDLDSLVDFKMSEDELGEALSLLPEKLSSLNWTEVSKVQGLKRSKRALFLDRDGVLLEDVDYLHDPKLVKLQSGAIELIRSARQKEMFVFVITNQSGIGRGKFSLQDYEKVNSRMLELLAQSGQYLDQVMMAPFIDQSPSYLGSRRPQLRKPRPGMIQSLVQEFGVDLSRSILVGDSATDLMAGALAGVSELYLLKSKIRPQEKQKWEDWQQSFGSRYAYSEIESLSVIAAQ